MAMMTKVYKTIFQVRRGPASEWEQINPILRKGEPGFAFDTNEFKIGDGVTAWNDLLPPEGSGVCNKDTHYDFPSIGKTNVIYKAEKEKALYQWNPEELKYELLFGADIADIEIIHGGNANGTA